jgi:hypothetical protein
MSWLYTLVVAGLIFAPDSGQVPTPDTVSPLDIAVAHQLQDETEKFEQTYPLSANGRVRVSNVNGPITIEAWDRNEVRLTYGKTADTKERLADVQIKIDSRPDYFSVEADHEWSKDKDHWRFGNKLTVEFKIMAPRGAVLNEIENVNGPVTVSDFTNVTRVSAVNGTVTAVNIRGNGRFSTVNGTVTAEFDRLTAGNTVSLDTVNGTARLVLPSDASATVKADSLNGNITNDFGLPVRKGKYLGRDLYGRLGNGDAQIKLNSVNGGLAIARKNDGKPLSPATNLLPQKAKSDEEWDVDTGKRGGDVEKLNKSITQAVKESEKAIAKAVVDAQSKIDKLEPELAQITADTIARTAESAARVAQAAGIRQEAMARILDAGLYAGMPRVEKRSDSIPVTGVPTVTIDAKGCAVRVRGWDKNEVQYQVTRFTDRRSPTPITVSESHSSSAVTLKVEDPAAAQRGGLFGDSTREVRIDVYVPRRSNLKITSDAEIRIEGVSGELELTGATEPVNVRDSSGKLRLKTSEGRVRLIGFRGEVESRTACGDQYFEGEFDRITATTEEGRIVMTVDPNENFDVHASVQAIEIESLKVPAQVAGGHWRFGKGGARYDFTVPDGNLIVRGNDSLRATN